MALPRYWVRLHDMLEAIAGLPETIAGKTIREAEASWTTQRALERGVEILSEASKHLPEDLKARYPAIPWPQVRAIGNHIRHGYERVDFAVIWSVATTGADELEPVLRAMLAEIEGPAGGPT